MANIVYSEGLFCTLRTLIILAVIGNSYEKTFVYAA